MKRTCKYCAEKFSDGAEVTHGGDADYCSKSCRRVVELEAELAQMDMHRDAEAKGFAAAIAHKDHVIDELARWVNRMQLDAFGKRSMRIQSLDEIKATAEAKAKEVK